MLPPRPIGARPPVRRRKPAGKRVVFVTPHPMAAKEEAEKYSKKGLKVEIKKEQNDLGQMVYVVYVFEGGFL